MKDQVNELELLLIRLENLELQMVELGMIEDGDDRSDVIGTIKEDIFRKIVFTKM
jgi:hypothetical protein